MSSIQDAPSALGDYMLSGWILTNRRCSTPGCTIPLLRSPDRQSPVVHLCVTCNENKTVSQHDISTSTSSASQITRTSTPATEMSEASDVLPPFVETEATRHRREQTDRASVEIGRRLLQGWTMLGDECPNDDCYYVPLVRRPKSAGEEEPKKECVLCGNFFNTERDRAGRERLVQTNPQSSQIASPSTNLRTSTQTAVVGPRSNPQSHSIVPTSNATAGSLMGTLGSSAEVLQLALQNLTSRMTSLVSSSNLTDPLSTIDESIARTADAVSKVTQSLSQVKQLQWSEAQAHIMS
ncbi:hypothetical protein AGABI2DRAFT_149991 [Agaricus bisporus var. bisporus H97]|uniref:hypothetical protein n=1 Tax=Agaricus bisporus var. bisporus (strain H97 / ATCC MYA-4626 / FGSC 10389) TaxID=936046 RepID=UPI00029F6E48|nr:hypothetical protein AGABI2DRAFT_149991 [Agaricus bisporus var. bisporus H97]EKV48162.1 hypothetical protein AGABI2DRAFT_149991 [Agaricus bisporus var. bisporus H97]